MKTGSISNLRLASTEDVFTKILHSLMDNYCLFAEFKINVACAKVTDTFYIFTFFLVCWTQQINGNCALKISENLSLFPVEDVLTYFHLENQQNISFAPGCLNF